MSLRSVHETSTQQRLGIQGQNSQSVIPDRIPKLRRSPRKHLKSTAQPLLNPSRCSLRSKGDLDIVAARIDVPKPVEATSGGRKRKRGATTCPHTRNSSVNGDSVSKRLRSDTVHVQQPAEAFEAEELASDNHSSSDCVGHWSVTGKWPPIFFGDDVQEENNMQRFLPRGRKLARSNSSHSSRTPSDRRPRDEKSAPYRHPGYELLLEEKGTYLRPAPQTITDETKQLCSSLLRPRNDTPTGTLFDDALFPGTIADLHNRTEWRVIQDIGRLLVPAAEEMARRKKISANVIETVNEGWNNSIPFVGSRPQPDYAVGFKASAFSTQQMKKLTPLIGGFSEASLFVATYQIFFPFLSSEVKCENAALDVADRQNAHTATVEVRGVFELFSLVGRQSELNGVLLAFSLSHDDNYVRIYGHYVTLCNEKPEYHRVAIRNFSFTELEGKEKWTAHNFVMNVYEDWVHKHLERICSAIDMIPDDIDFGVPAVS